MKHTPMNKAYNFEEKKKVEKLYNKLYKLLFVYFTTNYLNL